MLIGLALAATASLRADDPPAAAAPEPAALERLQRDYMTLARAATATAAELARLKEDLRQAESARATAERDRERLLAEAPRLRDELTRTQEALAAAQRDLGDALDARIRLQDEVSGQEKALSDLRRKTERLERQSGDAPAMRSAMDELRRERDRLMRERAQMERRLAQAEAARAPGDPRRAPAAAPPPDRGDAERVRETAESDRASLLAVQQLLESQLGESLAARERDLEEHRRERDALRKALEALRARLAIAPAEPPVAEPPAAPGSSTVSDAVPVAGDRSELETARKNLDVLNREVAALTDHAMALERRVAELQELAARAAEADALAAALATAGRDLQKARERSIALQALLAERRETPDDAPPAP